MSHRILFIVGALSCVGFFGAAGAAEMVTLRYGQNAASTGSLSALPLTVAERKGFFVREGINLMVVPIPGGTDRIVAALDKGEVDTGRNATPYLIQAVLKGSDAVAIVSQTANPVYSLIVRPEIKSFADLKGKVIGLSTPGDTITLSTLRLLARKGIKAADFQAKAVVGTSARFECLKSGDCVAVPMGQPEDLGAIKQGYPRLGFTYEAGTDLIFNVDMTRRAWGEKNQDTLVRFVRGFAASYEFINDTEESRRGHQHHRGVPESFPRDRRAAIRSLRRARQKCFAQTGRIESEGIQSRAAADGGSGCHRGAGPGR